MAVSSATAESGSHAATRIGRACHVAKLVAAAAPIALTSACGGVTIHPEPKLPHALLQPLQTDVGLIIPADQRKYTHKETRWGVDWEIALGPGHAQIMEDVFKDEFSHVEEFKDLDSARAASNLKALFEPRIDQYSFVTSRETGGRYYAVTIRYRINVYTAQGEKADTLSLTGYGNALAGGMRSGAPLLRASTAAMRDAAAKFLVQFPGQPAGQRLARNEAIVLDAATAKTDNSEIDAVPIEDPEPEYASVGRSAAGAAVPAAAAPEPSAAVPSGTAASPVPPPAETPPPGKPVPEKLSVR